MRRLWSRKRERADDRGDARARSNGASAEPATDDDAHAWWAKRDHLVADGDELRDRWRTPTAVPESVFEFLPADVDLDDPALAPDDFDPTLGEEYVPGLFRVDDPYAVLGVPVSATWDEIVAAHHKLAWLHHPDRLIHARPKDRARSEERIRDVNLAYAELRHRRGR